ncbi:MAG TPA: zinc ribbon domain-containing protein [Candidatus Binataceae bacterium]|nr:zinc ribbon domain-containing protein [Candidatus Binataceae bacterium]
MPIYEYKCAKCGTFEIVQRITEPALRKCPTCKSKVERLMSRTSFVLKGSGWYVTDYARAKKSDSKDAKGTAKSDSSASGADSGSAAGGSESAKSDSTKSDTSKSSSEAKTPAAEKNAAK